MLIPQEHPYLQGLNSYYLVIDKFVEHLQGEIGPGCLYLRAPDQEILLYFDEYEFQRGVVQEQGKRAQVSPSLANVLEALTQRTYQVTVFQLDPNAIFFWSQMPPFQRAKTELKSSDVRMADLVVRLKQKKFSGFIHVRFDEKKTGAIIFFHQGERVGGSYFWSTGGLDPSDESYLRLLQELKSTPATFAVGHFLAEEGQAKENESNQEGEQETDAGSQEEEPVYFSSLDTALEEFLEHYVQVVQKKTKLDPVVLLKQQFIARMEDYPFLDPFQGLFEFTEGRITFIDEAPKIKIADAIVACAWDVVREHKQEKKFLSLLRKWDYRTALEERNIAVEQ